MSDVHRPFWTSVSLRLRAAMLLVLIIIVAAVVGLIERTGSGSSTHAAAPRSAGVAVPVDDRTGASATPASGTTTSPSTAPATPTAPASSTAPARTTAPPASAKASPTAPLTYVVKPGDNLTVIAAWFHLHGYGSLYERNKAVIGDDPNLIRPGQRITLSGAGVSMSMTSSG